MAQTGFTPIQLYSTSTAAATPAAGNLTNSTLGSELAINITDGKLFYKDNANAVQVIGWKTVPTTAGGTGLTTYTAGDLSYYATGTTFTKLAIGTSGQILTSTGTAPQWTTLSGVAVTTFSAGTTGFTPNSATSGAITLAGTLITSNGGTGLSSYTAGDLFYYASGTALTKLAIGATGRFLSSTGSAPQWSAPAALTETDDTNVTMTLGGTPSTALLNSVSMTLGWTGQLAVSRGGTGTGTAFTAGSVIFAGASGVYSQKNANLFWDNTNNRLGVNINTPAAALDVSTTAGRYFFSFSGSDNKISCVNNANNAYINLILNGSNLLFQTSDTERGRFTSAGALLVGNTVSAQGSAIEATSNSLAPAMLARVNANSDESQWAFQAQKKTATNTTSQIFVRFLINDGATPSGYITANGANQATFTSSSDARLKENIVSLPNQLANILALEPVEFDYIDGSGTQIGFIAQKMQEIYPDAVSEGPDGMLQIGGWSKTEARLVKAIQEQQAIIEQLKAKVGL